MIVCIILGLMAYTIGVCITVWALQYDVIESEESNFESFGLIDDYADNGAFVICLLWPITLWFIVFHIIFVKILQFVERKEANDKR